jgi:hypothetical protein
MAWEKVNRTGATIDTIDEGFRKVNALIDDVTSVQKIDNIDAKTAAYTLVKDTDHTITVDASSADVTITLPAASTCSGQIFQIVKIDSTGLATIDAGSGVYIDGNEQYLYMVQKYSVAKLISNGTQWCIIGPK